MAEKRNRHTDDGKVLPCVIRVQPVLAAFLYRERLLQKYLNETELVTAIIRKWAESLPPMDWPAVLAALKADQK